MFFIFSGLQAFFSGPIRGLGKQRQASYACICVYYGIGLPIAVVLGFKMEMEVLGLQIAAGVAVIFQLLAFLGIIRGTDFQTVATQVRRRMGDFNGV